MENSRINVSLLWNKSPQNCEPTSPRSPLHRARSEQNLHFKNIRPTSIGSPLQKMNQLEETENDSIISPVPVRKKTIVIPKIPIGLVKPLAVSDKSPLSDRSNKSPKERGLSRIKSTTSVNKILKSSTHLKVPIPINENSPVTQEKPERSKKNQPGLR